MRKVYVVGVGFTKIGRFFDKGLRELFAEAAIKALDDIGGEKVQALVVGNMMSSSLGEQDNLGAVLADYAGLGGIPAFKVEAACGSGGVAVYTGYSLVASGLFDIVMVGGVEKQTEYPTRIVSKGLAQASDAEYELFYGISFTGLNALVMRKYMETYGISRDEMSVWPVLMHKNASKNPYAQLPFEVTIEQVSNSMLIADPIRLLDSSPIGDGAAALVLASEKYARKLSDTPVEIAGVGLATDHIYIAYRDDLLKLKATIDASKVAYRMAKVEPSQIDVVEEHDAFTILGYMNLEDLGFSERGKTPKEIAEGRFHPGDKPTVNPSGGLKARGHPVGATGVYQVAEVAMQLRGDYPGVKVNGEIGLAQSIGGLGTTVSVIILRR